MRSSFVGVVVLTLLLMSDAARAAPGDPDTSFSTDGELLYDIPGGRDEGYAVAIAPNDAIVVAGMHRGDSTDDFALIRVNPGGGVQAQTTDIEGGDEVASGVAFNGFNGKIVLTGFTKPHPGVTHNEFATARYDSALIPDPEFDLDGRARVDFGEGAFADDVAIDSSLRIVQVGSVNTASAETDFALTRFRPTDGYYDTTFSGDGKEITGRSEFQQANAVAIQSDDKIVVAGHTGPPGEFNFAVVRYTSGGSPDTTWAPDGWRETDFGGSMDIANDVAIQPDGKVVVVGQSSGGFTLVRYKPDGALDTSFSGDGKQTTSFNGQSDIATGVALQPDGRIVVAGYAFTGTGHDFALARYEPDGSLDRTFSGDGKQTTDLGGNDIAQGVALQSDGRIVLAGYQGSPYAADNKFALARYEGGGAPPVVVPVDPFPLPPIPVPPVPTSPGPSTTGTPGADVFTGTVGRDVFRAGAGDDRLRGGPAGDLLCGEAGNDTIDGEAGSDQLYGDACPGVTLAALAQGNDVVRGGAGNDRLFGGGGRDKLDGGAGSDRLDGGSGRDKLSGGAGNDRLTGGAGNDTLAGGAGRNRYAGGAGNDKLNAVNGTRDRVDCGAGRRDSARVDRRDRVKGCEKVTRRR